MKHLYTFIIAALAFTFNSYAQNSIEDMYEKYSDMENVTSIYISETMLGLGADFVELSDVEDINISKIIKKLTGLYILNITKEGSSADQKFINDINTLKANGEFEILMKMKEGGNEHIDIYMRKDKEKDTYSDIILIINNTTETALIFFQGKNISKEDIKSLMSTTQL